MKEKVLVITAVLIPEAGEKTNEELVADIKAKLRPRDIPWVEKFDKITVLSEDG